MASMAPGFSSFSSRIRPFTLPCEDQNCQRKNFSPTCYRAISCSIFNVVQIGFAPSFVSAVVLEALGSPTLLCILGSRMFFNLKEAAEHGVSTGTNWSSHSHSEIRFGQPKNEEAQ